MKVDKLLFTIALLLTYPLRAQEGAVGTQGLVDQITIELTDGEVNLDKTQFLPILKQSKTISDLLEDVQDVQREKIEFPLPKITKGEFEQVISLMEFLPKNKGAITNVLAEFDIKKLSTYWNIFNYLDVPDLLKLVDTDLSKKLFAQVEKKPQVIPELLQGISDEFKRIKLSFSQLESLLPESIKNKLISTLTTLTDHTGGVSSVAFDPSHNLLATGSYDKTVNIYTISDKNEIRKLTTLKGYTSGVSSVAFDPKHNLLATRSLNWDGRVKIYTISDKNKISRLTNLIKGPSFAEFDDFVSSVAFDPKHNLLAAGSEEETVNIYTISDKNEIRRLTTLKGYTSGVSSVAFDPSHNLLATGSRDWNGKVNIYTISDKNEIRKLTTLTDHADRVSSVAFDPKHNLLATGSEDKTVNIYTISDKNEIRRLTTLTDYTSGVSSVAFDPKHNLLAAGYGKVNIYTISDKNKIRKLTTLTDHTFSVRSVAFDPSHNLLATGSYDKTVKIYSLGLLSVFANSTVGQALVVSYLLEVKPKSVDAAPQIVQDQINSDPSVRQRLDDYLKKEASGLSIVQEAVKKIFRR